MNERYSKKESRGLPGGPHEQFTYVTGVFLQDMYHVPKAQEGGSLPSYQTTGEYNFLAPYKREWEANKEGRGGRYVNKGIDFDNWNIQEPNQNQQSSTSVQQPLILSPKEWEAYNKDKAIQEKPGVFGNYFNNIKKGVNRVYSDPGILARRTNLLFDNLITSEDETTVNILPRRKLYEYKTIRDDRGNIIDRVKNTDLTFEDLSDQEFGIVMNLTNDEKMDSTYKDFQASQIIGGDYIDQYGRISRTASEFKNMDWEALKKKSTGDDRNDYRTNEGYLVNPEQKGYYKIGRRNKNTNFNPQTDYFYGVQDGKLIAGPIDKFKDETTITPMRFGHRYYTKDNPPDLEKMKASSDFSPHKGHIKQLLYSPTTGAIGMTSQRQGIMDFYNKYGDVIPIYLDDGSYGYVSTSRGIDKLEYSDYQDYMASSNNKDRPIKGVDKHGSGQVGDNFGYNIYIKRKGGEELPIGQEGLETPDPMIKFNELARNRELQSVKPIGPMKKWMYGKSENEAQDFLTKMVNSPLFEERYNKMRGYKTPASKEEIENYRNHMLSNMQKVDWWPVGFDRDNEKYDREKFGSAWYDNMFPLQKDKYGVDIVPEDPQSAGLPSGKKSHTIFRSNNYDPTAAIHELSHASTNYYGLPANVNIPFSKNPEKEEYVKRFNTYHNRRNTEKKSYKDELAKYLYDAGIYDATTKRFDENDYDNVIKEYEKIKEELKKDPNNKALLEKKKTYDRNIAPYDKEQTIQIFNSFVDNSSSNEMPIGKYGGEGYRIDASGYNDPYKVIPSGNITMTEQDGGALKKGPLLGIDNMGNQQMMFPGYEYQFPGDEVMEIPVAQSGLNTTSSTAKGGKLKGDNLRGKTLNQRLYESITPIGYDWKHALKELRAGKRLPFMWDGEMTSFEDFDKMDRWRDPKTGKLGWYGEYVKDISDKHWRKYLFPEEEFDTFYPSKYKPSTNTGEDVEYMQFEYDDDIFDEAGQYGIFDAEVGTNKQVTDSSAGGFTLKDYTLSRGRDERGDYISYYDKVDFAPSVMGMKVPVEKFVGKPYDFYGRMYYTKEGDKIKRIFPKIKQKGGGTDEFDRILKKYTTKGWASLTEEEKNFYSNNYKTTIPNKFTLDENNTLYGTLPTVSVTAPYYKGPGEDITREGVTDAIVSGGKALAKELYGYTPIPAIKNVGSNPIHYLRELGKFIEDTMLTTPVVDVPLKANYSDVVDLAEVATLGSGTIIGGAKRLIKPLIKNKKIINNIPSNKVNDIPSDNLTIFDVFPEGKLPETPISDPLSNILDSHVIPETGINLRRITRNNKKARPKRKYSTINKDVQDNKYDISKSFRKNEITGEITPKSIYVKDLTSNNLHQAIYHDNTGTWQLRANWEGSSIGAGRAYNALNKQLPAFAKILEKGTLSLDSYKNIVGMAKREKDWDVIPQGYIPLNYQAVNNKMLDDLRDLKDLDLGELSWTRGIKDKKNLQEAADRVNNKFKFPDERRARIGEDGNIELPNYQLNRKYQKGGEFQKLVNKYTTKGWQSLTDQEKQTYKEMYQQYK